MAFDDEAVADLFDAQVDAGRRPEQFCRVWLHTHPGDSPQPSSVDEETFARVFGGCQWAVLFVLARGGKTYARLRLNVGPGGSVLIPVEVDYARPFAGSDHEAWEAEYKANVKASARWGLAGLSAPDLDDDPADPGAPGLGDDWLEELEDMDPAERQTIAAELGFDLGPCDEEDVVCGY